MLSLCMSGYVPYYDGTTHGPHPSAKIHKFFDDKAHVPLYDIDFRSAEFVELALSGRSTNPVALLYDTLAFPLGLLAAKKRTRCVVFLTTGCNGLVDESFNDYPSYVRWEFDEAAKLRHVVLGDGDAGGSWHAMQVQLLSPSGRAVTRARARACRVTC